MTVYPKIETTSDGGKVEHLLVRRVDAPDFLDVLKIAVLLKQ